VTLPRISIVTPSLNQAAHIERTIRSVLDQNYPELEYIVVDGGSTDGSLEIIKRYANRLARWVSEPDAGQANAINKGIAWATGEVVAYINSDDYYLPGAFAAAGAAIADGARWCAGRCRYEHDDGRVETVLHPARPLPRRTMIRESWYIPQASSFWRRDVFEEIGPLREDLHYVLDLEFGLRCVLSGVGPVPMGVDVAVRFLHDDAKSAAPERFEAEYARVRPELERRFGRRGDAIADVAYRARRRARRLIGGRAS
jgi:glycosyltransferase involved in cell wall biosynthesis